MAELSDPLAQTVSGGSVAGVGWTADGETM